jgi:hypothetical protein
MMVRSWVDSWVRCWLLVLVGLGNLLEQAELLIVIVGFDA